MPQRDEIIAFANELLAVESFADYGPNGLQVPGSREVRKLVAGVSANGELIERAVGAGADLLLVHHGLFWDKQPRALSEPMAARLRTALVAGLSIAAYHLPLDAHPEIGNNALLCSRLGLSARDRFAAAGGEPIGIVASVPQVDGIDLAELTASVREVTGRDPLLLGNGPDSIRSVGIVSGGGASFLGEALALGLDAMITGEPSEPATAEAREGGIHFLAAGHHATERLGVAALAQRLGERFSVEHEFVEVANPV